ncbi:MAG: 2-amino-4-hydroxy-6-hydroxymethyldihydropteridine diphosphokinase, partial [Pseudomonadota bacterium]
NLSGAPGTPAKVVDAALHGLSSKGFRILRKSGHFRSSAWPPGSGPDFVNGVVLVETSVSAEATLAKLHAIEADLGRERQMRWGARVIDLDLIFWGDLVAPDEATWRAWHDLPPGVQATQAPDELILPHPRLGDRAFVLVPMVQVIPDWQHPITGQTVAAMTAALPPTATADVTPLLPE